jgi:zinc transport system substrate-binding protein
LRHHGFILLALILLAIGCGGPEPDETPTVAPAADDSRLSVWVVNYPLAYFAERIGGDLVEVELPVPPDGDPAFWSPDADTVTAYQEADLILLNGAGYAAWVDRVTLPPSKLVDTSESFRDRYIFIEDSVTHSHGPEGDHSHGEAAFTTWLDPTLAIEHAAAIRNAFVAARPDHEAAFQAGFESLERDLLELDASLERIAAGLSEAPLMASHPVYQYLARRYGLNLESVHFEPDEDPGAEGWQSLDEILAAHPARWMLWEGDPLAATVVKLEERGVAGVVYDPCGNVPEEGNFLEIMQSNLANLKRVFPD